MEAKSPKVMKIIYYTTILFKKNFFMTSNARKLKRRLLESMTIIRKEFFRSIAKPARQFALAIAILNHH